MFQSSVRGICCKGNLKIPFTHDACPSAASLQRSPTVQLEPTMRSMFKSHTTYDSLEESVQYIPFLFGKFEQSLPIKVYDSILLSGGITPAMG